MAGDSTNRRDELARVSSREYNIHKTTTGWGPSKRFTEKGQSHNPTQGGGINRATKGKGSSSKNYSGNAQ